MADAYKINLYNFIQNFPNEQTCYNLLVQKKWSNGTPVCPFCGSVNSTKSRSKTFSYRCNDCRKDFSILTHTIMENTHISLQKWFLAILLMSRDKRGVSALELARDLDISNENARRMALNIKSAMSARESTYTLSGNVEMDEFYIGAPGGKQGRGTTKTPVLIAVTFDFVTDQKNKLNRYPNFMKMKALAVGEVNGENILEFCERYIEKGSTIYSDGAKVYNVLQENGYILHGEKFNAETNPMAMVHTAISNCKSYLSGTYHGSYQENIQLYLDEFSYRYNRRKIHENICERIYEIAATEAKVFRSRNHGKSEAGE